MQDLRKLVFSTLLELGHTKLRGLDIVSLMSPMYKDNLEEQRQLKIQQGPKKRTFFRYELQEDYSIIIAKTYLRDNVTAQHLAVVLPNQKTMEYHLPSNSEYSRLTIYDKVTGERVTTKDVDPLEAVNKILMTSYGLSQQPH